MANVTSICISCGVSGELIEWARFDEETNLGLCGDCGEYAKVWDEGERDVRHFRSSLQDDSPESLIENLIENAQLPSFPHVLLEIYKELDSNVSGVDRIVPLIESDPGLAARSLKLANSAFYARETKYTQIKDVVTRIGPFDLWSLLIATQSKSLFYGISVDQMDMTKFWQHSLFSACACRRLSEGMGIGNPGDMFVVGLLHDIGKLLLLQSMPVEYGAVLKRVSAGECGFKAEEEEIGVTHAQVGAELFRSWEFPELLIELTESHHQKQGEQGSPLSVLQLSDRLANTEMKQPGCENEKPGVNEAHVTAARRLYDNMSEAIL